MTVEQIVCVSLGSIFQVAVFVLGIAVGISLTKRKESFNDHSNSNTEAESVGCHIANGVAQGGDVRHLESSAEPVAEAHLAKRPARKRAAARKRSGGAGVDAD